MDYAFVFEDFVFWIAKLKFGYISGEFFIIFIIVGLVQAVKLAET